MTDIVERLAEAELTIKLRDETVNSLRVQLCKMLEALQYASQFMDDKGWHLAASVTRTRGFDALKPHPENEA